MFLYEPPNILLIRHLLSHVSDDRQIIHFVRLITALFSSRRGISPAERSNNEIGFISEMMHTGLQRARILALRHARRRHGRIDVMRLRTSAKIA